MDFELISPIIDAEPIAVAGHIREIKRLRKAYGAGRWRKLKGYASIQLADGSAWRVEVHWYETHGIGRKEIKIKYLLERESNE